MSSWYPATFIVLGAFKFTRTLKDLGTLRAEKLEEKYKSMSVVPVSQMFFNCWEFKTDNEVDST